MMKSIKFILSFSLILILFFLTSIFFESPKSVATFKRYSSPMYKLDKSLIDTLSKDSNSSNGDAEKKLISSVLDIIQYDKWQDFIDYIDVKIYYGNVIPNSYEELILSLNLSKDLGVIVIFEKVNDSYIFHSKIENLAPIENIQLINPPTKNEDLLLVYQVLDEKLGAFFYENFVQIYNYKDSSFNIVWEKTIFFEEIYKENWLNINSSNTEWTMVIEESEIDFDYTNPLKINTLTSLKKYKAHSENIPEKNSFSLNKDTSYNRSYYWDNKYNSFILGELTKDVFISNVAILEDMETRQEWIFGIVNPYYKVCTTNGEILYLPKSKFNGLFRDIL